jgi:SAM-dependent methyltransferase
MELRAMSNSQVATAYTYSFIRSALPDEARRILEIGCGDGDLAEQLQMDGLQVIAVDADETCVAATKARGVDARLAEWPADVGGTFDAVLFTRSLHHVNDLAGGISAAKNALAPGGKLIVEDFRAEGGTQRSSDWYLAMVSELLEGGALNDDASLEALADKLPPALHGGHELHFSSAIRNALAAEFDVIETDAAYYFRYLEPLMREDGAAKWLLDVELEQIKSGEIDALGKRFVASQT